MDHDLMIVLIWLALAISLLVLIQVSLLGALFLVLRSARSTLRQIERNLRASGVDLYDLAGKSYRLLGSLETAAEKTAEIVESLKEGLAGSVLQFRAIAAGIRAALRSFGQGPENRPGEHNGSTDAHM